MSELLRELNPLVLAYMGDAYIELLAREYLISAGGRSTSVLNKEIKRFVTAKNQSEALKKLDAKLTDKEEAVVKSGLGAKPKSIPRSASAMEYMRATALEALFGYMFFKHEDVRARQLFSLCYELEGGNNND